ncbi:MEDS domain-containing protein [Pyxidicoccus sp. 3LG]
MNLLSISPQIPVVSAPVNGTSAPEALKAAGETVGGLGQQIHRLGHGDHVCLIYETFEEQMAALVPFFQEGLARGECCAYIVDERTAEEVAAALAARGTDVEAALASGALRFLTKRDAYLRSGAFDPQAMIAFLKQTQDETLAAGFTGLRVTGEMTWALGPETGCERVIEYEALINDFFTGSRSLAICQYNRCRFPAEIIRDTLRTHPVAVVGNEVHENLFYETPEMVLGKESASTRVDWMVTQLQRVRTGERRLVELGEQLSEQAAENARLYREAQEAVLLRDEFLSVASHELKTPLTPLQLKLQGIKREAARSPGGQVPSSQVVRAVDGAEQQVRKLAGLVNELLDVARLTEGRLSLSPEGVDLPQLLGDVVGRFAPEAARAECPLRLEVAAGIVGTWDRQRLEQIITNLLTNALKYGAGRPVSLEARVDGGLACIDVRDEGIGIAPESLERIFGKFERAVPERHYGGLGLGLYIAQQLAHAMGGEIRVQSRLGEGSVFTVLLPLSVGPWQEVAGNKKAAGPELRTPGLQA